MLENFNFN